ncbi:MAG: TOBE domain-containing protein [Methylococcales bacterium]|nr:TOBE domain-containing protein [Methylococcales bacterium]MDD5754244.1 TOBE domain-containing protein [Methylococcales bacterium]
MKISARNQFKGVVSEVRIGAVNTEVHTILKGGEVIIASITKESAESLAIKKGTNVITLIKAPQVTIVTDFVSYLRSARNQLQGKITKVKLGIVSAEVKVGLSDCNYIVATVPHHDVLILGLHEGQEATAVFRADAVILAVAS